MGKVHLRVNHGRKKALRGKKKHLQLDGGVVMANVNSRAH